MGKVMNKHILVTGGTGYIGSHTVLELLSDGFDITILDNLYNSSLKVLSVIQELSGKNVNFVRADLLDSGAIDNLFKTNRFDAIIHFAGLKAVGESVEDPLRYYRNNVEGSLNLIEAALKFNVNRILFSSSATVYGDPEYLPLDEKHRISSSNPYGETKRVVEEILRSTSKAHTIFQHGNLRYFNPIGAHQSGQMGENPKGVPNNLLPYVAQVAVGILPYLNIWGNDYDTPDGTGVRDYIHVEDLAKAHLMGLKKLFQDSESFTVNLGTGVGYSVLEVIKAFEKASGRTVKYKFGPRRDGDIATCFADPTSAYSLLGWRAEHDIDRMCEDHWRWQKNNPSGFE